jgi:hypothetical protein
MDISLSVVSEELNETELQSLTRQLCVDLNDEIDNIDARLPVEPSVSGHRGDPVTVGTIIVTLISSGAVVALINVLKSYIDRPKKLKISITDGEGKQLMFESDRLSANEFHEATRMLEKIVGVQK